MGFDGKTHHDRAINFLNPLLALVNFLNTSTCFPRTIQRNKGFKSDLFFLGLIFHLHVQFLRKPFKLITLCYGTTQYKMKRNKISRYILCLR